MRALAIALVLTFSTVALAQAPGETFTLPASDASTDLDAIEIATHQPLSERAFLTGTALTVPSGTAEVSGRMAIGAGYLVDVAIGLGRGTELWLEAGQTAAPFGSSPFSGDGSSPVNTQAIGLKQVFAHGSRWQIAGEASLRRSSLTLYETPVTGTLSNAAPAISSPSSDADYFLAGTLYATGCFDARCRVAITAAGTLVDELSSSSGVMPIFSATANVGGEHLRGLAEVIATPDQASGTIRSMLLFGGRYGWTHVAIEGGVVLGTDDEDTGVAPFVGVSTRL
jgi:hypothetical protein